MGVASVTVRSAYAAVTETLLVSVCVPPTAAEGRYCPLACVVKSVTRSAPV
jgi:hypothetical protein